MLHRQLSLKYFFLWRGSLACCKEAGLNEYINRSASLSLTKTQLLLMLHITCILYWPQTFESTKWRPAKANYTSTSTTFGRRQTQTHKNKETAQLFVNSFTHIHAPMDTCTRMHEFIYTISLVLFPHTLKSILQMLEEFQPFLTANQ